MLVLMFIFISLRWSRLKKKINSCPLYLISKFRIFIILCTQKYPWSMPGFLHSLTINFQVCSGTRRIQKSKTSLVPSDTLLSVSFYPVQIMAYLPFKLQCNLTSISFSFFSVSVVRPLQKAWLEGWVVLEFIFFLS